MKLWVGNDYRVLSLGIIAVMKYAFGFHTFPYLPIRDNQLFVSSLLETKNRINLNITRDLIDSQARSFTRSFSDSYMGWSVHSNNSIEKLGSILLWKRWKITWFLLYIISTWLIETLKWKVLVIFLEHRLFLVICAKN